jgi:hypothetical protein
MRYRTLVVFAAACALGALSSGCSTEISAGPPVVVPVASGRLTVLWTIQGSTSPAACAAVGADALALDVYDVTGAPVDTFHGNCEDFAISVDLPEGDYSADATLVDVADRSVSTTLTLNAIRIVAGTELTIDTDFPGSSIL